MLKITVSKFRRGAYRSYGVWTVLGLLATLAVVVASFRSVTGDFNSRASVLADTTVSFTLGNNAAQANQDGSAVTVGASQAWIGTGQNAGASYLGLNFSGGVIPAQAQVKSANLQVTAVGAWIPVSVAVYGDRSGKGDFSSSAKPGDRTLTASDQSYSDNVNWAANQTYTYDVTAPVIEEVGASGATNIALVIKGTGTQWGRKYIYGKSAVLNVVYTSLVGGGATIAPIPPTAVPTAAPVPTVRPTIVPTNVPPTRAPTAVPTLTPSVVPTTAPTAAVPVTSSNIYGAVSADLLGTCPAAVHDRYVTTGPDGKLYRTWHPQTVPLDANNPSGPTCTFAHEHGDDPATAKIYAGPVPFDYIAAQAGMDEPHSGFKCFVHNAGTVNDEGTVDLVNSYYCFHMGTGGAARFSTRFHSLDFHSQTASGSVMNVQGLSDVGNVGTICDNPRQSRTVMGLGCLVDSPYEIWSADLAINNQGNTVANAVISTAVFDPITVMNPANITQLIYAWDPLAMSQVFKFR